MMRMKCSECACVVERGERAVACANEAACCCLDVPLAEGAERV